MDRRQYGVIRMAGACGVWLVMGGCAATVPPPVVTSTPRRMGPSEPLAAQAPVAVVAAGASSSLSLAEAIARALVSHPRLAASRFEVAARTAEAAQAARPPNPSVSVELEDLGREAGSSMPSQTTISVAQRFELGNKRALRTSVAALERDAAAWDLELERAEVVAHVASAFVAVLSAEARLELARADADTAEEVSAAVAARVAAGVAAPPDGDRAEAAARSARILARTIEMSRDGARAALAGMWGGRADDISMLIGSLGVIPPVPAIETIDARIAESPGVVRWATELERRRREAELARAGRVPDVDVGAGVRRLHETSDTAIVVGATVGLPFLDRRRDAIAAARAREDVATAEQASATLTTRQAIVAAHASASAAASALAEIDARVIPLSERAYSAVLEGYRAGRFGLLDVLEARRALAAARVDRLQTSTDLHQAVITIERLLGVRPGSAVSATSGVAR
jgi:cobalt-zinc-cadmium efflux system outer membrane protein